MEDSLLATDVPACLLDFKIQSHCDQYRHCTLSQKQSIESQDVEIRSAAFRHHRPR